ncbi:Prepilin peptidase dependent protein B [Escherichia coli]|nr:Prepilin peptidase dependent protein B [Escherichia coli]
MPVKEQGFSLLEVLIAMAISSVLLLGRHAFCLRYSVKV